MQKKKRKFLYYCPPKTETNASTNLQSNRENDNRFFELENKLQREELFLLKQYKDAMKDEISDLKKTIKKFTEDASLSEKTITRLQNERAELDAQISLQQAEIENLKQIISTNKERELAQTSPKANDNESQTETSTNQEREQAQKALKAKISECQAEIAKLKEKISIQAKGKFENKDKIRELNIQLRQQRLNNRNLNHELASCKEIMKELTEKGRKKSKG